jgi:phage head maturation protease
MRILKRAPMRLIKSSINSTAAHNLTALIAAGAVDKTSAFSFTPKDGEEMLGAAGTKWFLGEDTTAAANTSDRFKYAFGKNGKVYRSALVAIRSHAALENDDPVFAAAGRYIDEIDGTKNYGRNALPMHQQAWAKFEYKAMTENDTHYLLSGVATTPTADRMQDIVEPMGGEYELPLPFLWQHDNCAPVGEVYEATPTVNGIPVSIRIPKLAVPGTLKNRLDEAVQSIALNLVRGLSIGFAPVEYSYMEDTGGYRFIKWLWLELSGVTIPANAEATIMSIKTFDAKSRPSSGRKRVSVNLKADASANDVPADIQFNIRRKK